MAWRSIFGRFWFRFGLQNRAEIEAESGMEAKRFEDSGLKRLESGSKQQKGGQNELHGGLAEACLAALGSFRQGSDTPKAPCWVGGFKRHMPVRRPCRGDTRRKEKI